MDPFESHENIRHEDDVCIHVAQKRSSRQSGCRFKGRTDERRAVVVSAYVRCVLNTVLARRLGYARLVSTQDDIYVFSKSQPTPYSVVLMDGRRAQKGLGNGED